LNNANIFVILAPQSAEKGEFFFDIVKVYHTMLFMFFFIG